MAKNNLGEELRMARQLQRLSLKSVAEPAEISTAYLQKLEGGEVKQPSPHILYRLAAVLNMSYAELMELAGYIVPGREHDSSESTLSQAFKSVDLTEEEKKAVAAFISHLRRKH